VCLEANHRLLKGKTYRAISIRTRRQTLSNGKIRGGIRFGVGSLAHLLQNRFCIGEVVYRGGVHVGEQEPIVDRSLFEAVQARLAAIATNRRLRTRSSPTILAGRIFDDRGNRMTPSHTRKRGVRYRYYISHALLQNRAGETGSVPRVPAHEIEIAVLGAVRARLRQDGSVEAETPETDRDLIEQQVQRVIVKPQLIEVALVSQHFADPTGEGLGPSARLPETGPLPVLRLPWTGLNGTTVKGIVHPPSADKETIVPANRDVLLSAIAKARAWVEDLPEPQDRQGAWPCGTPIDFAAR
jgi:hypothetical protein